MKKLIAYPDDTIAFFKEVVASKRNTKGDPDYKARLTALEGTINPAFNSYDDRFSTNKLEALTSRVFTDQQKDDLLQLYSYKNSVIQKLKIKLTTIEFNKVINTCQCCTIGEVSSFDHLVPKDEFPEFSINPKNLFPCCSKCNSYKNIEWRTGGVRNFLNLFLDDLPAQQYLFANLSVDKSGLVNVNFELKNSHGINAQLFSLIKKHYTKLDLLKRFKENSDSVITPVISSIKAGRHLLSKADIATQIQATCQSNQVFFGPNYWKSILELSLSKNKDFINAIYDAA